MFFLVVYFLGLIVVTAAAFFVFNGHYLNALLTAITAYFPLAFFSIFGAKNAKEALLHKAAITLFALGIFAFAIDLASPHRFIAGFSFLLIMCAGECVVIKWSKRHTSLSVGG